MTVRSSSIPSTLGPDDDGAEGDEDGSVHMAPFTHELLSQYVGTSREIVTHYMNQFRRQGYLRYSRKGILLYRDAMKDWLRQQQSAAA